MNPEILANCIAALARERTSQGWDTYLLTFLFDQLPGNDVSLRRQQQRIVERAYAYYLTRVVRRPRAPSQQDRLPIWVCAPDLPVFKHEKQALVDVTVNDGWHVQGIALHPPWGRHAIKLDAYFLTSQHEYVKPGALRSVDAKPITRTLETACGYTVKMLKRRRITMDDIFILPRTRSEMDTQLRGGRNSSLYPEWRRSR